MIKRHHFFAVSTALALSAVTTASFALEPFSAEYQFSYNGKNLGSATRVLKGSANNWEYVVTAKAAAIASITETSHFGFSNNQVNSKDFKRHSKILMYNDIATIQFDPSKKIITTKKDDTTRTFAWEAGVLDELNAELQIREDLKRNALKPSYPIADAKGIDQRHFVKQGTEKITSGFGTFDTVKVIIQNKRKPERETIFWLAPKLDYAPVKVFHKDKDKTYGLLLKKYQGTTN